MKNRHSGFRPASDRTLAVKQKEPESAEPAALYKRLLRQAGPLMIYGSIKITSQLYMEYPVKLFL